MDFDNLQSVASSVSDTLPLEEPDAEDKDPVVFTGLETVWVTVDKVGIPTLGLDGTGPARPLTLAPAQICCLILYIYTSI
jgi:hypothetical protein